MSKSILYLVPDLLGTPGGIARYSGLVCKALVQDGFLLRVLSRMDRQAQGHSPMDGLAMNYQSCNGSKIAFAWQAFWQTLGKHPAIILVGHPHFALLGWLLARISGARLVVFIYGMDVFKPLASSRRWALQRADEIISISQFTAQQAVRTNGIPPERVRVLHNCLDPQFEDGLGKPNTTNLSILTVGRLSPYEQYKGHDYVIRAMPALLAQFPNLVYDVVGDGAWRADLEQLATQVGVSHAVCFHGEVSEEMLRQHYAGADLFIMPSRAEGFGFVFLEAMAHGMPVIGGNLDATPEVVVDGVTGYLVNPTSVESIVEAASRLLGDEALRRKMGQAAAQHVKQNFGYLKFQQQLSTYLAELVPVQ